MVGRLATWVIGLTFLLAATVHGPAQPVRLTSFDFRPSRIAVIGDSYTTGTDEGGLGAKAWTSRAWQMLSQRGLRIDADVAAEGRAGYGMVGNRGSVFADLTARAVKPDDVLVMFFGSRNDQGVDLRLLADRVRITFDLARRLAPTARFLVIGPPWPTADVPVGVLQIRDVMHTAAHDAGAAFVDPIERRWFVDRPDLIGADGVHPNDTGHAYMARKIAPLVRNSLAR